MGELSFNGPLPDLKKRSVLAQASLSSIEVGPKTTSPTLSLQAVGKKIGCNLNIAKYHI